MDNARLCRAIKREGEKLVYGIPKWEWFKMLVTYCQKRWDEEEERKQEGVAP